MSDTEQPIKVHQPCKDCHSSDALAVYLDHTYCFSCGKHTKLKTKGGTMLPLPDADAEIPISAGTPLSYLETFKEKNKLNETTTQGLRDRGILKETCAFYGVGVKGTLEGGVTHHVYPYYSIEGLHIANKVREVANKQFLAEGRLQPCVLFGQNKFSRGCSKYITICEGELDALAAYQMLGSKHAVVSIKDGATGAYKNIKASLEYLDTFERVYLCFDNDEPGKKAALKCAPLFTPGKCRIVKLDDGFKDACDYLKTKDNEKFTKAWWRGEVWTPDGIISSSSLKDRIKNRDTAKSVPYPWDGLNELTYGIRPGELVVITADTGVGKTAVMREICYNIMKVDKTAKVGTIYLEEVPEDSGLGLMSLSANIPMHLPDAQYTDEVWEKAFEETLGSDKVYFYDSFGSTLIDNIIQRVRYYARGLDCKYIFIDHLSIIVSDQRNGDERKALDEITTKLKTLTIELGIAMIAVVHTNRAGSIRGTAGIEQLSNIIIHLDRDKLSPDADVRNTTNVTVWKNRFSGFSGPACSVKYDKVTGRLTEAEFLTDDTKKGKKGDDFP